MVEKVCKESPVLDCRASNHHLAAIQGLCAASEAPHIQLTKSSNAFTEAIPNITPLLKPSILGDVATYFFFGAGGLFLGGETGLLTGTGSAARTVSSDPESRARIETAFKKFRADVLRKEADALDGGKGVAGALGF